MIMKRIIVVLALLAFVRLADAERINQEGRILGTLPAVTNSILLNTTNADAVIAAMQIFPVTSPYNEDVSRLPVLANSDAMMARITTNFNGVSRTLRVNAENNYVLVPTNQRLVQINLATYPDSDLNGGTLPYGLYPIPTNLPVEPWPFTTPTQTIQQWQTNDDGSDRHAIIVEPGANTIWETYETLLSGTNWQANIGAMFNMNTNQIRGNGVETGSADTAGLAIFPMLVRYDECERGMVEHACSVSVEYPYSTGTLGDSSAYIYPATSTIVLKGYNDPAYPKMGQRLRLKASFVISNSWTIEEKALLLGLKKYGAFVADRAAAFFIEITADDRWPTNAFNDIRNIAITNMEAIQSTGVNEGPRSPGAPVANAGADQSLPIFQTAQLNGSVSFTGTPPAIQWKLYSGPGTVTFGDAAQTNTTASFSVPGIYTLELSADDGVHAVAYDAAVFTVADAISVAIARIGTNVSLTWTGGSAPFVVQSVNGLPAGSWSRVVTTSVQNVVLPITNQMQFFRVQSQ